MQNMTPTPEVVEALQGTLTELKNRHNELLLSVGKMRADMLRWMVATMLLTNRDRITLSEDFLRKADGWQLERAVHPEGKAVSWRLIERLPEAGG